MEMRYPFHPDQFKRMTTTELRENFHVGGLFEPGQLKLTYSHVDRVIVGGAMPAGVTVELTADKHDLGTDYFLERREIGIINIGGAGVVTIDGTDYLMAKSDSLYAGKGVRQVVFASSDSSVKPCDGSVMEMVTVASSTFFTWSVDVITGALTNDTMLVSTSNLRLNEKITSSASSALPAALLASVLRWKV